MLHENPALMFENSDPKRSSRLALALALMACSLSLVGCSGLPQSSSAQTSAHPFSMQTVLPSATVGSSYREVLNVSGGQAPYTFGVSQGELPTGLVLNALTGSISGIPTRAGTFPFTITVTGEPFGPTGMRADSASAVHAYTVTVVPSVSSVTVQISPAGPSIAAGGKVQFAAAVSNTSNTAVGWSASAGTISSTGLFTAPASGNPKSITVTASSVAQAAAQASAAVTITSNTFVITTSNLPAAVESSPYSASLTASGGTLPYHWKLVSGSLPAGLQLDASTGTLSGSPAQAGTFPFSVSGTDAASHTAQQSLSLLVSTSGKTCGPPAYECSRSDPAIVQLPSLVPNVGNLSGANTIVTDPDFGNRIVRITDANTDPSSAYVNRTYSVNTSGSADDNLWNTDSTLFITQDTGGAGYPFTFNPSTFQAARMYVSNFPATNGLMLLTGGGIWSRVNPNVLYSYGGTAINKYDFTDRTNPPSPALVYDFTSSPNCLPGFTATWQTIGGVSAGDTVFGMGYSNTGYQDTGVYVVAYKVGSGCSVLNTQTGQVTGDWGATGTIGIADRWYVHNVKISRDGNWAIISRENCISPSCAAPEVYFWQIGTTNATPCAGAGGNCEGHYTEGYTHYENNDNSPLTNQVIRTFADPTAFTSISTTFPVGDYMDQHQSWHNVDPGDSVPFLSSTFGTASPYPGPWYNEIIAVAVDGSGKTWRFAHSFITGLSSNFDAAEGIGTVSQDGKFFIFSSDWMGKLGSVSGATTCTISSDCRGDVFVVELR